MSIVISLEDRRNLARKLSAPELRVIDCQRERQQAPHLHLMDQLKRTKSGLDSGMSVEEIRRFERARILGIIKNQAEELALFYTPTSAANALRSVADEIEGSDT